MSHERITVVFEECFPLTVFDYPENAQKLVEARQKTGHRIEAIDYVKAPQDCAHDWDFSTPGAMVCNLCHLRKTITLP